MASDIWQDSISFLEKNIKEYGILVVLFLVILAVIYSIASGLSTLFFILYVGSIGFTIGSIILFSLWGLLYALVTGTYMFALKDGINSLNKNQQLNYVGSITNGFKSMTKDMNMTYTVSIIGLVSGFIYGAFNALSNYGLSVIGQILSGVVFAAAIVFLLSKMYGLSIPKLVDKIKSINHTSPNAGLFMILTIVLPIIPIVGALEIFMLSFALVILTKSPGQTQAQTKR